MSAKKFIDRLEQQGLLDDTVIADLRRQVSEGKGRMTSELLAKWLVDHQHLTKYQATKVVTDVAAEVEREKAASKQNDDLLGLAPLDDEPVAPPAPPPPPAKPVAAARPAAPKRRPEPPAPPRREEPPADLGGLTPLDDLAGGLTPISPAPDAGGLTPLSPVQAAQPGLDLMQGPSGGFDTGMDAFGAPAAAAPTRPRGRVKKNPWDSKLMLLGGGAFILLVGASVVLYYSIFAGSAAETFNEAEEQYKAGSYTQAITIYDKYLEGFPDDKNVSVAKVRRGIARLRHAMEINKDPDQALKAATEVLPTIENEKAFDEARPELATLLPDLAAAFASQAKNATEIPQAQQFVDLTEQAMELVNTAAYLPTSHRKTQEPKIKSITEDMELAKYQIQRETNLNQAIAEIQAAVGAGDPAKGFGVYKTLLSEYPALDSHPQLREAVLSISKKEQELVSIVPFSAAASGEEQRSAEFSIVLANRSGENAPAGADQVALQLLRGSVYALNAETGGIRWRRHVGNETRIQPQLFPAQQGGDVLLCDQRRNELLRLQAADGKLVWRLGMPEPFATPAILGERVFIPLASGKLAVADARTGEATQAVQFPQGLSVSPGAYPDASRLFQVSHRTNLYVLAGDSLACTEVYYLGHKPGSVTLPAMYVQSHVLVIENAGKDYSQIHIVRAKPGEPLVSPQEPLRVKGNVLVPPAIFGRRVVLVTDLSAIYVLDVDAANDTTPVSTVATLPATSQAPLDAYPLVDQTRLWVADRRLTRYDIQVAQGKLARAWIDLDGDVFVAPLQRAGEVVISARRPNNSASIVAMASDGQERKRFWQSELATPAGYVAVDPQAGAIRVISAGAALFNINKDVLAKGYNDQPTAVAMEPGRGAAFTEVAPLDGGRLVLRDPQDHARLLVYDPTQAALPLRLINVPANAEQLTATPVGFGGGILAPAASGSVFLLDPLTGSEVALPFQPPLEAGTKIQWRRPAVLAGGAEFVVVNDRQLIYRIGIKDQPQRHLAPIAEATLDVNIVSPLAVAGDMIYGVTRGAGADIVLALQMPELKPAKEFPLQGRILWGPESAGDAVLVQSDSEGLLCFAADGQQKWASAASYGPLAGKPLVDGASLILASVRGTVWRVSAENGQELARVEMGEPLAAGPVPFNTRLLLCGADGTVHVLTLPAAP